MKQSALKNIEKITREVERAKNEYERAEKQFIVQNELERALETTEITNNLKTLQGILSTISNKYSKILDNLELKGKGRPKKRTLEELPLINENKEEEIVDINNLQEEELKEIEQTTQNISKIENYKNDNIVNITPQTQSQVFKQKVFYTVPFEMVLFNKKFEINNNWREVYINTLEELIKLKGNVVKSFPQNKKLNGRKMVYFSFNPNVPMISKYQLSNGMFVNLNLSSTAILKNCYRVLKACGYTPNKLVVKVKHVSKDEKVNRKNI